MKSIFKISFTSCLVTIGLLAVTGCSDDLLEENPYTVFTTEYLKTPDGFANGVYAAYSGLRYDFGPNGALAITNVGTDEWTYGDQPAGGQDPGVLQDGQYNISTQDGNILTPWNRNYYHINLCNAIIDYAPEVQLPDAAKNTLVAEAHYLRAQYYFMLVTQFGAVPLDLGAGELRFNTNATTDFHRLPVEELIGKNYQAMIDDLTFASENLPDQRPANAFRLSKSAALHLLAKVYLYRGYSTVQQGGDFQAAYTTAKKLIDNKAQYGVDLLPDYADVHRQGNDYNKEILFSVERIAMNNSSNEVPNPGSDFANKVNIANNMFNCNYQQSVPASYYNTTIAGKQLINSRPLQYGRPLRRYVPTRWLFNTAFADKLNDSRYDNSFRTVWLAATYEAVGTTNYTSYVNTLATYGLVLGDTAIYLAPSDAKAAELKALAGANKKKYWIVSPSEFYSNQTPALQIYPNLKKYDDNKRANFNDVSGRPFKVARFAETYLIAAEAAMQIGNLSDAATYINAVRTRAAFRPLLDAGTLSDRIAEMQISEGDIDLDFILDERARELAGESVRWPDLAVRGKLVERVKAFNPDGAPNVKDFHMLRPIPQSQLNAIGDTDKNKYQNPGYF
jgi:hypothetical protein